MWRFLERFSRRVYVIKGVGPVHTARVWKRGAERGLYITGCGLVVSTHSSSKNTPHCEYHVIVAKMATCNNCREEDGEQLIVFANEEV